MKKLLVVLLAAMMVLSIAAVSMAAATVEGDWRAEWVQDDSKEAEGKDDLHFNKYDLRFNIKGQVSDTVDTALQIAYDSSKENVQVKEYKVNFNQSWGKLTAGSWDHKLFPSRVLLKPHGDNKVRDDDMQFVFDIPVDAFTFGLFVDPDLRDDEMNYDLKFAYNADSFGVELHYGEQDPKVEESTYIAFDAYYNIDPIKVFLYGIQADDGYDGKWIDDKGEYVDLVPVLGAQYKSGPVTTSFEYTLEKNGDYNPYGLKFAYGFTNKVTLEVEYTNVNEDDNKIVIRPRVKF